LLAKFDAVFALATVFIAKTAMKLAQTGLAAN
jgi:hypothetical protein